MEKRKPSEYFKNRAFQTFQTMMAAILGLSFLIACGKVESNQSINQPIPPNISSPNVVLPEVMPSPTNQPLTTDWHVCGEVQEGEGVIAALERAAQGGEPPHEWSTTMGQIIEIRYPDGRVEVFSWKKLLKENPVVQPGTFVCDTIKPRLSATTTPRPEDIHR